MMGSLGLVDHLAERSLVRPKIDDCRTPAIDEGCASQRGLTVGRAAFAQTSHIL